MKGNVISWGLTILIVALINIFYRPLTIVECIVIAVGCSAIGFGINIKK